jgi:hypothetical protein
MAQQARNVCMFFDELPEPPRYLICDRDTKFTKQFQEILKSDGVEIKQVATLGSCDGGTPSQDPGGLLPLSPGDP